MQQEGPRRSEVSTEKKLLESDDSSISSKSSKMEDLEKKIKSANKQFTQLKAQLEDGDEDDDDSEDEQSHFQFVSLANKAHHAVGLKQSANKLKDLDLRGVILLDNQSAMSLFCNRKFVSNIRQSEQPLTLRSNGGSMKVTQVASITNQPMFGFEESDYKHPGIKRRQTTIPSHVR